MSTNLPAIGKNKILSSKTNQPGTTGADSPRNKYIHLPSFPNAAKPQRHDRLKMWLLLLTILCLGGLGSFSLAKYFIPTSPPLTTFIGNECTTTPQDIKYGATPAGSTGTVPLPGAWFESKRSEKDFSYAQACAASFVVTYQTFDAEHVKLLEASTYMLSAGAKQRFYGHVPGVKADIHMDTMWRATLLKHHLQQVAQASAPRLLAARNIQGKLLVWMVVPYRVSTLTDGQTLFLDSTYTVLLVGVPALSNGLGTGWQVSAWSDGAGLFTPPDPL